MGSTHCAGSSTLGLFGVPHQILHVQTFKKKKSGEKSLQQMFHCNANISASVSCFGKHVLPFCPEPEAGSDTKSLSTVQILIKVFGVVF